MSEFEILYLFVLTFSYDISLNFFSESINSLLSLLVISVVFYCSLLSENNHLTNLRQFHLFITKHVVRLPVGNE